MRQELIVRVKNNKKRCFIKYFATQNHAVKDLKYRVRFHKCKKMNTVLSFDNILVISSENKLFTNLNVIFLPLNFVFQTASSHQKVQIRLQIRLKRDFFLT
jgi:hypothetical protein